jgi:hypothetical protein
VVQSVDYQTLQELVLELVKNDPAVFDLFLMKMRLKSISGQAYLIKKPLQWDSKQILSHTQRILAPLEVKEKLHSFVGEDMGKEYNELLDSISSIFEAVPLKDALTILTMLTEPVVNKISDILNYCDEGQSWNEAFNLLGQYWEQFALRVVATNTDLTPLSKKLKKWREQTKDYTFIDPFFNAIRVIHK